MVRNESRGSQGYLRSGLGRMNNLENVAEDFIDTMVGMHKNIRYLCKDLVPAVKGRDFQMVIIYLVRIQPDPGIFLQSVDATSLVFTRKTLVVCGRGRLFDYPQVEAMRLLYEKFYASKD